MKIIDTINNTKWENAEDRVKINNKNKSIKNKQNTLSLYSYLKYKS